MRGLDLVEVVTARLSWSRRRCWPPLEGIRELPSVATATTWKGEPGSGTFHSQAFVNIHIRTFAVHLSRTFALIQKCSNHFLFRQLVAEVHERLRSSRLDGLFTREKFNCVATKKRPTPGMVSGVFLLTFGRSTRNLVWSAPRCCSNNFVECFANRFDLDRMPGERTKKDRTLENSLELQRSRRVEHATNGLLSRLRPTVGKVKVPWVTRTLRIELIHQDGVLCVPVHSKHKRDDSLDHLLRCFNQL